jgi:glycosyltransferase involved in cell wall biosynthesis
MEKLISVCAPGHPLSTKTWSKTPYNICQELNRLNLLGECVDIENYGNIYTRGIYKLISYGYYRGSIDLNRGALIRKMKNKYLCTQIHKTNKILHFTTLSLPITKKYSNGFENYLVIDSTWNILLNSISFRSSYKSRLIKDAEELENRAYEDAHHIFSISDFVKKNLINHYKIDSKKISVIGTGRGIIQPFYGDKNYKNKTILFVAKGNFIEKGGQVLLDAFKIISKTNSQINLIIAGDEQYKALSVSNSRIDIYGFIPLDKLQELFNRASLFVLPASYEPWGLVYLEALSCKIPIVGFNKNAFPEISNFGEYGFIAKEESSECLAHTILQAFISETELRLKGERGQKYCLTNYTWEKTTNKIVSVIFP